MPANNLNRPGFYSNMPFFAEQKHPKENCEDGAYRSSFKSAHVQRSKRKCVEDRKDANCGDCKRRRATMYDDQKKVSQSSPLESEFDRVIQQHRFARKWYSENQSEMNIDISPPLSLSDSENGTPPLSDKDENSISVFEAALSGQFHRVGSIPFFEEPTDSTAVIKAEPTDTVEKSVKSTVLYNAALVKKEVVIDNDIVLLETIPETMTVNEDAEPVACPQMVIKQEPQSDDSFASDCGVDELLSGSFTHIENDVAGSNHSDISSAIDGNIEFKSTAPVLQKRNKAIKINITRSLPPLPINQKPVVIEEELEDIPYYENYTPVNVKPALKGINLKKQPMLNRDQELTALCSIM